MPDDQKPDKLTVTLNWPHRQVDAATVESISAQVAHLMDAAIAAGLARGQRRFEAGRQDGWSSGWRAGQKAGHDVGRVEGEAKVEAFAGTIADLERAQAARDRGANES